MTHSSMFSIKKLLVMVSLALTVIITSITMPSGTSITSNAASVKLKTKEVFVQKGKTTTIKLKNKSKKSVTWSVPSEYKNIVKITKKSKTQATIKGKSTGAAIVNAKVGGKTYSCSVVVTLKEISGDTTGTLNVLDYGATADDGTDDTSAIQSAIQDAASGVTIYIPAGTYNISINSETKASLYLKGNTTLFMDPNAILKVSATSIDEYSVLYCYYQTNAVVKGGQIIGELKNHTGSGNGEGHGIAIKDSSNVTISNVYISKNWGDGIYIGSVSTAGPGCSKITIDSCVIYDNGRSNISIVDANTVKINKCEIANAKGHAPQAGIDIEPNNLSRPIKNVTISNTSIHTLGKGSSSGQYFCIQMYYNPSNLSTVAANKLTIKNCKLYGDVGLYSAKNAKITNTTIKGTLYDVMKAKLKKVKYESIWRP